MHSRRPNGIDPESEPRRVVPPHRGQNLAGSGRYDHVQPKLTPALSGWRDSNEGRINIPCNHATQTKHVHADSDLFWSDLDLPRPATERLVGTDCLGENLYRDIWEVGYLRSSDLRYRSFIHPLPGPPKRAHKAQCRIRLKPIKSRRET